MASSSSTSTENGVHWALPPGLAETAKLQVRLDVYDDALVLTDFQKEPATVRMVAPQAMARAFMATSPVSSPLLGEDALWWGIVRGVEFVGLWRAPRVWPVALQQEAFKPPLRLRLPMPGLVFFCAPESPPWVWAALHRPRSLKDQLYHAPLFNVFTFGATCPGSHRYPERASEAPDSFFAAYFTEAGDPRGRSKRHPEALRSLWDELNGTGTYPVEDLVEAGTLGAIIEGLRR